MRSCRFYRSSSVGCAAPLTMAAATSGGGGQAPALPDAGSAHPHPLPPRQERELARERHRPCLLYVPGLEVPGVRGLLGWDLADALDASPERGDLEIVVHGNPDRLVGAHLGE